MRRTKIIASIIFIGSSEKQWVCVVFLLCRPLNVLNQEVEIITEQSEIVRVGVIFEKIVVLVMICVSAWMDMIIFKVYVTVASISCSFFPFSYSRYVRIQESGKLTLSSCWMNLWVQLGLHPRAQNKQAFPCYRKFLTETNVQNSINTTDNTFDRSKCEQLSSTYIIDHLF